MGGQAGAGPYREVTWAAMILGIAVGVVLTVSMTYAGLVMGFTVPASAVAAIVGWGVLRGVMRRGSIVENNINQAVASSVNIACTGIIFTVPVLFMMGRTDFDPVAIALAGVAGSFLGVLFMIPLRKQMIDLERLRFPSGVAVAAMLKAPGAALTKTALLLAAISVSAEFALVIALPEMGLGAKPVALFALAAGMAGLGVACTFFIRAAAAEAKRDVVAWTAASALVLAVVFPVVVVLVGRGLGHGVIPPEQVNVGKAVAGWFGAQWPPYASTIFALSLTSVGAGYISGRPGLMVLAGGVLANWIVAPIAVNSGWVASEVPLGAVARLVIRPVGIGMLLGGALAGVAMALPMVKAAFAGLKLASAQAREVQSQELHIRWVGVGVLASIAALLAAALLGGVSLGLSLVIAAVGTVWIWFAGIVVSQCAGRTDWSPVSGLALLSVTLMLWLANKNVPTAILLGAAVCVALTMTSDMMQDLKTGQLVGGQPRRLQVTQISVSWIGPIIALAVLYGLHQAWGFGPGTKLPAPQADALKAAIEGVLGGNVPLSQYGTGAAIGGLLTLAAGGGIGVLVGLSMYLPMFYILPYGVGCLLVMGAVRFLGRRWADDVGLPIAAGFLVGDSLANVAVSFAKLSEAAGAFGL